MNLYSPPNKGYPQELPDRWRFADGTVRTDLKSLTNEQLAHLDWIGPIVMPVSRQRDEEGNDLVENYDYDPLTHKPVWYAAKRKFVFLENHIDETPYTSGELIQDPNNIENWGGFKVKLLSSPKVNQFIATGLSYVPAAAITLPSTVLNIENEGFGKFATTWGALISAGVPIPEGMLEEIISEAIAAHIPQEFIDIIS